MILCIRRCGEVRETRLAIDPMNKSTRHSCALKRRGIHEADKSPQPSPSVRHAQDAGRRDRVEKPEHVLLWPIACFRRLAAERRAVEPSRERRASEVEMGNVVVSCPTLRACVERAARSEMMRRTKHPPATP